jgi:hypothetical protein
MATMAEVHPATPMIQENRVAGLQFRLAHDVLSVFVQSQSHKGGMAQPTFGGPFDESKLSDELRSDPLQVLRVLCAHATAPAPRVCDSKTVGLHNL